MVAGVRGNGRTGASVRVDYAVLIKEIRPWPPSPTLRSLQSALIHWENGGGRNSGSTKSVVPILGSGDNGDGSIEFNEVFRLSLRLQRDLAKSGNSDAFLKNVLEFNLYEPRRDSISKGQLVGTAIINLAEYGIVKEPLDVGISVNCKRNFRNMSQPILYIRVQPVDKSGRHVLPQASSVASAESESFSTLGNEEYLDEVASTSFSDEDEEIRSGSSGVANAASPRKIQQVNFHTEASSIGTEACLKESEYVDVPIHGVGDDISEGKGLHTVSAVESIESPSVAFEGGDLRQDDKDMLLYTQSPRIYNLSKSKDVKIYPNDKKLSPLEAKVQQLEKKIQELEGELSEAATMEAALFSVSAEHGGSVSKVHTPARRLSRFYRHTCGRLSNSSRTNTARSIISGLIFVSRASGSDVPRLTYWLTNSVMLRAIISQTILKGKASYLKSQSFHSKNGDKTYGKTSDEEVTYEFLSGLEKVEGWIFSRIVESLWWQSLTPHMQTTVAKSVGMRASPGSAKSNRKVTHTEELDQVDISMEIWKRAFKDACGRLCPVRGGGHECGCLPVLAKLVMEQLVVRLDVAMFNAILRESSDEIPTDPLSDPISDPSVLPIPPGKCSFRTGALLKNAIGNWSRWLTDLFGLEEEESELHEDGEYLNIVDRPDISIKLFRLLNALSDLMMLPKDMLLDKAIRKEVCPLFCDSLIKRVLYNFLPDEFCPDPVPDSLMDSFESETWSDEGEESVTHHPMKAPSTLYHPPSATSITVITGDTGGKSELRRSRSSLIDKAHNSDDELDELNSPWSSILSSGSFSPTVSASKPACLLSANNHWGDQHAVRYELVRDIWTNYD
ncbi:hypothetical protein MLD38_013255 [Melastoma candidum]|uniref:Uncharacterized protein n=1 Tax=Melastoma candidum TaxID=119954 RepID=A0ACB9R8D4_9MYRT|nr:hypothetical protein MLD38_013255 [Melastoma candidum]